MVEDESVFLHDALIRRRMWAPEGKRPIVVTTGSHQKTCVFGTLHSMEDNYSDSTIPLTSIPSFHTFEN